MANPKLFKFSKPEYLNACISESFEGYGYIYKQSALLFHNLLMCANLNEDLKLLIQTHLFNFDGEHPVSPNVDLIVPVIFLYRHSIELDLKSLYLTLKSKECIKKNTTPNRKKAVEKLNKHSLFNLWNMVNPLLHKYYLANDCNKIIKAVSKYIKELDTFDPDSIAFRYPYSNKVSNNKFEKNLNNITHINLLVFYAEINKLCDYIEKFKDYFQGEYEFYDRILYTTDSSYYNALNRKKSYISEYQYNATMSKIELLCERFIEPCKDNLNKNLVRDLFLLNKRTKEYCEKRKNNIEDTSMLKDVNNARRRIRYQCKKIIGSNKNYY